MMKKMELKNLKQKQKKNNEREKRRTKNAEKNNNICSANARTVYLWIRGAFVVYTKYRSRGVFVSVCVCVFTGKQQGTWCKKQQIQVRFSLWTRLNFMKSTVSGNTSSISNDWLAIQFLIAVQFFCRTNRLPQWILLVNSKCIPMHKCLQVSFFFSFSTGQTSIQRWINV